MKIEPERRKLYPGYPALACLAATLLASPACSSQQTAGAPEPATRPELATDAQRKPQGIKGKKPARPRLQSQEGARRNRQPLVGIKKRVEPRPEPAPKDPPKEP